MATATPTYSLNTHAPDQPIDRSRLPHWFVDLAAPCRDQSLKRGTDFHEVSRAASLVMCPGRVALP
jgi:hypothetical protein